MKLIKEGIAKEIPANLVAEYKAHGWQEIQPAKEPEQEQETAEETEQEPEQEQEKPKRGRSKKEA